MTEDREIICEIRGAAGVVVLNRPKALNALSLGMVRELARALDAWENNPQVARVVVISTSEKAFSAGGDIRWLHDCGKAGRYDEMQSCLGPWHDSVNYGLSTFVEENSYWRSLCHAWSAHPVLEFQQRILGVTPTEPGFARIKIEPHRCGLTHANGSVCTPHGMIEVAWRLVEGKFELAVTKPVGIEATILAPNGETRQFSGGNFKETFNLS